MKSIIVAVDKNNAIGFENDLPWGRLMKDDMAFFKKMTTGASIIMGRRTFESMDSKPLPNRENIVVSHTPTRIDGVMTALSLQAAYELARYETFVIGGGQVYAAAIDDMDKLYITEVDAEFPDATVYFPAIDLTKWHEISREHHDADERNTYAFDIVEYAKN